MKRAINVLSFVTAAAIFAAAGQAQVVMSQVYGGGGGAGTYKEDFVVLFNKGTTPVTLTNAGIFYASSGGNFTPSPVQRVRLPISLTIPAGQSYLVVTDPGATSTSTSISTLSIGGNPLVADFTTTGNTAATSGQASMSQTTGKVALIDGFDWTQTVQATAFPTASSPVTPFGTVLDFLGWGAASNSEGGSPAAATTNVGALFRNSAGCDDSNVNSADWTVSPVASSVPRTTQSGIQVCGALVPDVALSVTGGGACGSATIGSDVTYVATATNNGSAVANGSTVTITLSNNLGTIAAPGALVSGNTVTWTLAPLATGGGSATLNITASVVGGGTVLASGVASAATDETALANNSSAARNFIPFAGAGYSASLTAQAVFVPAAYETATGFSAGALGEISDGLGGTLKLRTLQGRPTASANGNRFIFWADSSAGVADFDGFLIAGQVSGNSVTLTPVAAESATIVDSANNRFIRPGVAFSQAITAPAINNNGDFAFATQVIAGGETAGTSVVAKSNVATPGVFAIVARQNDAASAAVGTSATWGSLGATTITNTGAVSFSASLTDTPANTATNFAVLSADGATLVARKGVTVPGGLQGTNAGAVIAGLDHLLPAALGFSVDAAGTNVLVSGTAGTNASEDGFVAVNGTVALQENYTIAGSGLAGTIDVGSPFDSVLMQADGSWYAIGDFEASPASGNGVDFVVRNGVVVAKSGDVATGSGETWSDVAVARTFTGFTSNGADQVIFGLVNNPDTSTDNVAVWKNGANSQVLFREGQGITINGRQFYANFLPANRGQAWINADRKLFTLVTLYEASNICTNTFTSTVSALVSIDLPATGPVCNNPSNVAGPGQNTTAIDAELTADDIIVFLNRFFAGNLLSNVAGPGQNTTALDNELTADDIIVFLNRFFAGC